MSDRDERSNRLSKRLDDDGGVSPPVTESDETVGYYTAEDEDDTVRVQFRVPEKQRDVFNQIGYGEVSKVDDELAGLSKPELQNAAIQVLLDHPELWAKTARKMYK